MATTYSTNARLQKPSPADRQWDAPLNANTDALDAMTAVGALVVTPVNPSSDSLDVRVTAGSFVRGDGTVGQFPGVPTTLVPPSATTYLWLDADGTLVGGPAFPTTPHLRLAHVIASATAIVQVVDERVQCAVAGTGLGFVLKAGDTVAGLFAVAAPGSAASGPSGPLLVADPINQLLGFFGTAPASQAARLTPLTGPAGGLATDALVDVGSSYAQATLNNNFASLAAKVDALIIALQRHGLMAS